MIWPVRPGMCYLPAGIVARGILPDAAVRDLTLWVDRIMGDRISFLNEQILALLHRLDLPLHPTTIAMAEEHN